MLFLCDSSIFMFMLNELYKVVVLISLGCLIGCTSDNFSSKNQSQKSEDKSEAKSQLDGDDEEFNKEFNSENERDFLSDRLKKIQALPNPEILSNGYHTDGTYFFRDLTQEWKFGMIMREDRYKNGRRDGLCKNWGINPNWQKFESVPTSYVLTTEVNYRNGEKNGEARSYHFSSAGEDWNGNIAVKGNYRNNKADGIWVTYYVNGQISAEIVFKEDRLEGYNKLYSENGESIPITEPNNFTNMIGKYEEKLGIINHWTPY